MASLLYRLGDLAARRRWMVLLAWLVLVIVMTGLVKTFGANTSNNLELPGADSQGATDLLAERFPPQQNGANPIVFRAESGTVDKGANKQAIQEAHKAIAAMPHVASATSPFSQQGQAQISKDKKTAFIPVLLDISNEEITEDIAEGFLDAAERPAHQAHMKVAAGGQIGTELSEPDTESSDIIGLMVATVILAFTFGSLVAMGLPIFSAVIGLSIGLAAIGLLGHVTEVPTIAPTLGTMIGLGVGIDYALFLVSRHRSQLAGGMELRESIARAVMSSGSAIVFAGGTVVIALISLVVAGIPLVASLGYTSALAVVTAVLASISFLPGMLGAIGERIHSVRLPRFLRPAEKPPEGGFWGGWARWVTTHPGPAILISLLILVPLMIPFFSLELGQEDVGATPKDTTERQAFDLIASGFGPGYNGPLLVAISLGKPATPDPEFEKQYKHAQSLQSELTSEQATGQSQAASLQAQADALKVEQARLEAQADSLQVQGADLGDEKAQLKRSAARLKKQRTIVEHLSALTAQASGLARTAAKLAAQAAAVGRRLENARTPEEQQRLQSQLDAISAQQSTVRAQAAAVRSQAEALRAEAGDLGQKTLALASEAADAIRQGVALVQAKNKLQLQAANAKTKAAKLQTQKAQLQLLQQQAQTQQKQAENLKTTLTAELTSAGGDHRGTDPRLVNLQNALKGTIGVDVVSPPKINDKGDAAVITVISKDPPASDETAELVGTVRDYVIPQSTQGTDLEVHVGGSTASYEDLADAISAKLGLVIFVVIALGFAVLMMAFRSVLVPTQAAISNVLAVCAAFGVVTATFQYGWGLGIVGLDTASGTDPVASFVPLIMFAVLFGLSMDYQVFLMSQIEHARTIRKDDREAIALGLATGARVIVAAALIMISVFASFILNGDPTVKQFGVGLAVGVALAASTVLLFAPAVLVLSGKGAWWVPKWADHFLPHIDIEGEQALKKKDSLGSMEA